MNRKCRSANIDRLTRNAKNRGSGLIGAGAFCESSFGANRRFGQTLIDPRIPLVFVGGSLIRGARDLSIGSL